MRLPPKKKCPSSMASTQLAALAPNLAGTGAPARLGEKASCRVVARRKPRQPVEQNERHAGFFSSVRRPSASARRSRASPPALPIAAISASVVPPSVVGVKSSGMWPSSEPERSGRTTGSQAEALDDVAQLLDIARRQMAAGQHVDRSGRAVRAPAARRQMPRMSLATVLRPAVLEGVFEVRRRDIDQLECRRVPDGARG